MGRVTYQAILPSPAEAPPASWRALGTDAIDTRRRDADRKVTVRLSKAQARWLRDAERLAGTGADAEAILRALVDLGRQLEVDWSAIDGGGALREAVRRAVLVRRSRPGDGREAS